MNLKCKIHIVRNMVAFPVFIFMNFDKEKFTCPICEYRGPFKDDIKSPTGVRKHAQCPKCNAQERHRIQYLILKDIFNTINPSTLRMLHFAPEPFFRDLFLKYFERYDTADLNMYGVDYNVDLQALPFEDHSYDFIFASHVLEHIPDDRKALSEIKRILKSNGIAILPVPIVADKTVEYPEPNPNEIYHVRAPGFDYFDRYEPFFSKVDKINSDSLPKKYQVFIYENRGKWPTKECPFRPSMQGDKHVDIVPVCYV